MADDFAFCSPDTRRLDIDELTVCHYLQNIRQLPRNLGLHSKDRLLINQSPPMPLVTAIFDSFNESGGKFTDTEQYALPFLFIDVFS